MVTESILINISATSPRLERIWGGKQFTHSVTDLTIGLLLLLLFHCLPVVVGVVVVMGRGSNGGTALF